MKFIQEDYFKIHFKFPFEGIITDPPYKNLKGFLREELIDFEKMMNKFDLDTQENSFLIIFCNFKMAGELYNLSKKTHFQFHTYQIWNKFPSSTFIDWSFPLRFTEFILYFQKGNFRFNFKSSQTSIKGYTHSGYNISGRPRTKAKRSYHCFPEIISFKSYRILKLNKKHQTEKPKDFSKMFYKIVGNHFICDPFCGTGNLLSAFPYSLGIDIDNYITQEEKEGESHLKLNNLNNVNNAVNP